ncbi:MAG: serine/threonine-protein kinase [Sandaracinaceae bacterium]
MHFCPECRRIYQSPVDYCSSDGEATIDVESGRDPLVGVVFDERYELVRQVGSGGNGVVYLARQLELGRLVAFKMMYAERIQEPRALKRFAREARALAALDHPGCVRVHDFRAPSDSVPYLVMDLVEGHPLDSVIADGGIAPGHAVLTALRIAEAVDAAHRAGIVHRDLNPENVILDVRDAELRVRLIDFGLAIVAEDGDDDRLTRQGRVVGTPDYMSPEQVRGGDADGRSDLYALGVLLFEMLEGMPPFHGPTPSATAAMHLEDDPPPLHERGMPEPLAVQLNELVQRLLAKRPDDRPATGEEVAAELSALLDQLPGAGPASELLVDVDEPTRDVETASLGAPVAAKPEPPAASRKRAWWVAVPVLLGVAIVLGLALRSDPTPAPPTPETPQSANTVEEPTPEGRLELQPDTEMLEPGTLPQRGEVEMPGGDAQAGYESALRAMSVALSGEGLRPRDVRSSPRGARAWNEQSNAARRQDYEGALEALGAFRAEANARTAREWMVYRLQAVERRLGEPPPQETAPRLRALWGTLDASARSPAEVRRFMARVDGLERGAR